jgi:pimeloyl-ACP methyl ester carboxylesterase
MSILWFIKFYCEIICITTGICIFTICFIPTGIAIIFINIIQQLFYNKNIIYSVPTTTEYLIKVEKEYADNIVNNSSLNKNPLYYESIDQIFDIEVNPNKKFRIHSHSIVFRKQKNKLLPIIIFIHGANSGPTAFFKNAIELSKNNFEIHCIGLPGFGESIVSIELLQLNSKQVKEFYTKYIAKYITKNCNTKPHIIGHSFGGFITSSFVVEFPNLCESFVLCNPAGILPIFGKDTMMWGFLFSFGFPNLYYIIRHIGWFINISYYAYSSITNNYNPYIDWNILQMTMNCSENFGEKIVSKFIFYNGIETYWRDCTMIELLSIKKSPPISLIWGDDDTIVPIEYAKIIGYCVKNSSSPFIIYSILNTWHSPMSNEKDFSYVLLKALKNKRYLVQINNIQKQKLECIINNYKIIKATCDYSYTYDLIKNMYSDIRCILQES